MGHLRRRPARARPPDARRPRLAGSPLHRGRAGRRGGPRAGRRLDRRLRCSRSTTPRPSSSGWPRRTAGSSRSPSPRAAITSIRATGPSRTGTPTSGTTSPTPDRPTCSFGYLAEALDRRRLRGLAPFTVMSCDNLLGNGDVTRRMLLAFLELRDPSLRSWVAANGAFPNSMVDRITPATTDEIRALVRERVRHRGRLARGDRAVQAVGDRGRVLPRAARLGGSRRPDDRRRPALREDEAPPAQRQPPGHVLHRDAAGLHHRARGPLRRPDPPPGPPVHGPGRDPPPAGRRAGSTWTDTRIP